MKHLVPILLLPIFLFTFCKKQRDSEPIQPVNPQANEKLVDYSGTTLIGAHPNGWTTLPVFGSSIEIICRNEFNLIEPTCYPFNWTSRYEHDMTQFQSWVDWAQSNNKKVMMHMLIGWNLYSPSWFLEGKWSATELETMMDYHIQSVVSPVREKVNIWNVVNEALRGWEDSGNEAGKFRVDSACVWNRMGWEPDASGLTGSNKINDSIPVYIRKAFEDARKYTNAELELRDYGFEFSPSDDPKLLAFYQLAKHLINKGVNLGAIGFQGHINGGNAFDPYSWNWENFKNNISKFKSLGLKVYLTEVDISTGSFQNIPITMVIADQQKAMYNMLVKETFAANVDGIFFWGVADGVDQGWRTYDCPLLYDTNFSRKPAYYGVLDALQGK